MTIAGQEYPEWRKEAGLESHGPAQREVMTVPLRYNHHTDDGFAVCPFCARFVLIAHSETRCAHYHGTEGSEYYDGPTQIVFCK